MQEKKLNPIPRDLMFALDIGTRTVIGVLSKKVDESYIVIDVEVVAHPERAMLDGQIHDIAKVTKVVEQVVANLEARNGFKLERASIAAAGRSLKIAKAKVESPIDITKEIDKNVLDNIEMQAIQEAQGTLISTDEVAKDYYCVGHSVIGYELDGAMILNPLGHRGKFLSLSLIATFLPHIVVDSLYAVVHKAGLEVMNLTLEPIAAMNVAIPKHLRMLNLALVDVGAGTSDIAISREGSVMSYGMVAKAGDKLTEQLAQRFLLDFNTAEKLKVGLCQGELHEFTDVIGMIHQLTTDEILEGLDEILVELTKGIAQTLLELNQKPPSAIFCIGGGSQIPNFTTYLANATGVPKERVVIKQVETLERVSFECEPMKGPEYITPVGIGITAFEERDHDFIQVTVNETTIRMFHSKPLTVSDALVITGYSARKLIAERGESIEVLVDGKPRTIRGDYGEPAKILLNGASAALHSKIGHKDHVVVIPAEAGKPREVLLEEIVNYDAACYLNETQIKIIDSVLVNGIPKVGTYKVQNGDVIETVGIKTIYTLAQLSEIDLSQFDICLGEDRLFDIDGIEIGGHYTIQKKLETMVVEEVTEAISDIDILIKEKRSQYIDVMINGESVQLPIKNDQVVIVDIFDHIDFDLSNPQGVLNLRLNGERAKYTDLLAHGDIIEVKWLK